jgi:hypothetical protein
MEPKANSSRVNVFGLPIRSILTYVLVGFCLILSGCAGLAEERGTGATKPVTPLEISLPGSSYLPSGGENSAYSATLAASGGTTPYTWSLSSGQLPAGLTLASSSGLISGIPTESGTFSFTVVVKDSGSPAQTVSAKLSVTIDSEGSSGSSSNNCPTGEPCGASAPYCENYTPPSTSGATAIDSLPFKITSPGNYYLNSDLSSSGVGIAVLANNVDINLNGHTLTYGTSALGSGASQVGEYGILMCNTGELVSEDLDPSYGSNGFCANGGVSASNVTIENGAVIQSPDASEYYDPMNCPGSGVGSDCSHPHPTIASHAILALYNEGVTIKQVTVTIQNVDSMGIQYRWQQDGQGMDIECNTVNDRVLQLNSRENSYAAIWSGNQVNGTGVNTIKYNTVLGSPQGGIVVGAGSSEVPGTIVQNNDIDQGYYQFPPFTTFGEMYSNDYALGVCIPSGDVSYNYVHSMNGRGISCIYGGDMGGLAIHDNYVSTIEQQVNAEYSSAGTIPGAAWPDPAGCEIDGGRGFESKESPNIQIYNNSFHIEANQCGAGGIVFTSFPCVVISCPTNGTSFSVDNNQIDIENVSGSSGAFSAGQDVACYVLDSVDGSENGYFSKPFTQDTCITDGDYIQSDGYNPADNLAWVGGTFTIGSHPLSTVLNSVGRLLIHWSGQVTPPPDEKGYIIQDFTFTNGAGLRFEQDGTLLARGATVEWTYTPTVDSQASGSPISGASVNVVDQGGQQANCTTDAQGQCSVVLRQEAVMSEVGQSLTTVSMNPNTVTITASGCTALTYGLTITATTSETRTLNCP